MKPVISVEHISKRYNIVNKSGKASYNTFRDSFSQGLRSVFSSSRRANKSVKTDFWALQDINFEINQGDRVGIIGRNGAGKSTLLKILSRIVSPTTGRITIEGRVGSLLEVGTGFHPELTGRENIFLNGSLLGMGKTEITKKFDEIVSFAEVEKFLDTPVKRYSSGMYVRLAFAVAAHLEPEILIVDEVLAVGDSSFQKKCLGKMEDVAGEGRTVLFVSHNMETVLRLCNRCILLENGRLKENGLTDAVIKSYLNTGSGTNSFRSWEHHPSAPGNEVARLIRLWVEDKDGNNKDTFEITTPVNVFMEYEVLREGEIFTHSFNFHNEEGVNIFNTHDVVSPLREVPRKKGRYITRMTIPANLLAEGTVVVGAAIIKIDPFTIHFHEQDAISFNVVDYMKGDSARGNYTLGFPGIVRPLCNWETKILP